MEFEYPRLPTHTQNVVYRRSKSISRSLDGMYKPVESVSWRPLNERSPSQGPPFLTLYTNRPIPKYQKSEPDIQPERPFRIPSFYHSYRMPPCPGAPKLTFTPLPPCDCCERDHRPRARVLKDKETRILAWLKDVEPVNHGPWVSFLPTCESSNSSGLSLDSVPYFPARSRTQMEEPEPTSFVPVFEDQTESRDDSTDHMDTWPYDGRGLYEHHPKHECGLACYGACQRRRKSRAGLGLGKVLTRIFPWISGKQEVVPVMLNSDVPHPPWWLSYRSNDDTLKEDEDDGDLELWLEHTTQGQLLNHELRFQLPLNQKPDTRIFSSWSELSF
ncbi:hypothetical protein OPQ81_008723 [Rhizoctonia solani]|nr:hypothetical protein OPQ81_008723 [Rhizoctonia solani]